MKVIGTLIAVIVLALAAAAAFVYSGWYNIAATDAHAPLTRNVLSVVMRNSVEARADDISVPDLSSSQMIRAGAGHYSEYCVTCHGAPGMERGEIGKGLTPKPPELSHAAQEWSHAELFWIVKHGIKMTGMPAWGVTHSDEELWNVVAFVAQLPQMKPEQYTMLVKEAGEHQH